MSEREANPMKRGKTEVETCVLNNWNVGTVLRGHEQWSDGNGVWTTIRITAMGESHILARAIRIERTNPAGEVTEVSDRRAVEGMWTLHFREWTDRLDTHPARPADRSTGTEGVG